MDIHCHVKYDIGLHQVVPRPWEAVGSLFDTKNGSVQFSYLPKSFLPTIFFNLFQIKNTFVCKIGITLLMPNILHVLLKMFPYLPKSVFLFQCIYVFVYSLVLFICLLSIDVHVIFYGCFSPHSFKVGNKKLSPPVQFYLCQRCKGQAC